MPDASPFTTLSRYAVTTVSPKSALVAVSRSIEARAMTARGETHLWVCLQDRAFNVRATRTVHDELAARGVTVHVYGCDVRADEPRPAGIHSHDISPHHLLAREWTVLLVSPDMALAMAAREVPTSAPQAADRDRRFEWLLSSDVADVRFAAATLPTDAFTPGTDYARL